MEYRIDDNGVAHGLRQHSIGSTFPVVVVGRLKPEGGNVYYLKLGEHESLDLNNESAQRAAENLARIVREHGLDRAKERFKQSLLYKG